MHVLLGQAVDANDGPFGTIKDIMVDPENGTIRHLMVRPFENESVTKLVPFWLIRSGGQRPIVGLPSSYAMRLEMVPLDGLVSITIEPPVAAQPAAVAAGAVTVNALDLTTRLGSRVRSIDGDFVGRIGGFATTNQHIDAVLVHHGEPGATTLAAVPMIDVEAIKSGRIDLRVSRAHLDQLAQAGESAQSANREGTFAREIIYGARRLASPLRRGTWPNGLKAH